MKMGSLKWVPAVLALSACTSMMENVRTDLPCPEGPAPSVVAQQVGYVVIAVVERTGTFDLTTVDVGKQQVVARNGGKSAQELTDMLAKMSALDPSRTTLHVVVHRGSPWSGDVAPLPLPGPNPPGDDKGRIELATKLARAYVGSLVNAPAAVQPAATTGTPTQQ